MARRKLVFLLVFATVVAVGIGSALARSSQIWSGTIGDITLDWSTNDIVAKKSGDLLLSVRQKYRGDGVYREITSLVGNYMTLKLKGRDSKLQFVALDLTALEKPLMLTDIFDEKTLVSALLHNESLLAMTNALECPGDSPKTLAELKARLSCGLKAEKSCAAVPDSWLSGFLFHSVKDNSVIVRVGLPTDRPNEIQCRGSILQFSITLPMPEGPLGEALKKADAGTQGFVLQNQRKIVGDIPKVLPTDPCKK